MAAIYVAKDNFESEVLKAEVPVLVDFFAQWCAPCKMLMPIVEMVAEEVKDAKICKIDIDENPELTAQYRIMSVPTLMVFKNGEAVARNSGVISKDAILNMLKA